MASKHTTKDKYHLDPTDPQILKRIARVEVPVAESRSAFNKMVIGAISIGIVQAIRVGINIAREGLGEDPIPDGEEFFSGGYFDPNVVVKYKENIAQTQEMLESVFDLGCHDYLGLALLGEVAIKSAYIDEDTHEISDKMVEEQKKYHRMTIDRFNVLMADDLVENSKGELVRTEEKLEDEIKDKIGAVIGDEGDKYGDFVHKVKHVSAVPIDVPANDPDKKKLGDAIRRAITGLLKEEGIDYSELDLDNIVEIGGVLSIPKKTTGESKNDNKTKKRKKEKTDE